MTTSGVQNPPSTLGHSLTPSLLPWSIGFFLAFRLFFVLIAVRVFGQEAKVGVGTSLVLNYLLLGMVAFHSFGPGARTLGSILRMPLSGWAFSFFAFTGVSLLWSVAASRPSAVAFWCAMVADCLMVLLLLRTGPVVEMVSLVMKGYVRGACTIAVLAWLLPSQSDLRLGDEELLGPNQIGYLCAFALFFVQYLMRFQGSGWNSSAVLLSLTLLRSLSKTTILAFVCAQTYILLRDRSVSARTRRLLVFSSLMVLLVFSGLLIRYYDVYTHAGNQSETLTGRIGIWAYFLNEAMQSPWMGHGFHSVWKVIPPFGYDQFEARHAHNELLQQFYAYGVVGVALMVGIYGSLYRNLRRLPASSLRVLFLGMLMFALIRGLADTEAFDLSLPMWTLVMIGSLMEWGPIDAQVGLIARKEGLA